MCAPSVADITNREFHVTLYQANFASHHTRNRHVGFLSQGVALEYTLKCPITFYLFHTTIPNYNWVKRASTNTLSWNFNSFYEVNQVQTFFVVFLYTATFIKETKWRGKITHAYVRDVLCKTLYISHAFIVFLYTTPFIKETKRRSEIMHI